MSRRAYKTVNLPRELVDWIDQILRSHRDSGECGLLGIASRDEFVRVAVVVLGMACKGQTNTVAPLEKIQALVQALEKRNPGCNPCPRQ